MATILSIKYC